MRLPITAWASITHRATGVFLFAGVAVLLWALEASLASPESFASLQTSLSGPLMKLVIWAVLAGLIYHSLAGIKHLVMDFGIGETMGGGRTRCSNRCCPVNHTDTAGGSPGYGNCCNKYGPVRSL